MEFCMDESCGKCNPCRTGTVQMLRMLEKITDGTADKDTIPKLEELCLMVKESSLCALGGTAPNPIYSTLRYFRDEYEAHIMDHHCKAGVCYVFQGEVEAGFVDTFAFAKYIVYVSNGGNIMSEGCHPYH